MKKNRIAETDRLDSRTVPGTKLKGNGMDYTNSKEMDKPVRIGKPFGNEITMQQ